MTPSRTTYFSLYHWPFVAIACFLCLTASSQYENLLNKTHAERTTLLWKLGASIHYEPDSIKAFAIANKLIGFAKKYKDIELELEGELYKIHYGSTYTAERHEKMLKDIITKAIKKKSVYIEAKARDMLAELYWDNNQNYELALEEYSHLDHILQTVTIEEYPEKLQIVYHIGNAYFYFQDYTKAIQYFRKIPKLATVVNFQLYWYMHSVNNMSLAYQKLGKLDSADYYWNQLYAYSSQQSDSVWMGIIKGNLGQNEYLRGNYEKAIPLMKYCIEEAINTKDWGLASGSLMPLADIYFKQNKKDSAVAAVKQAEDLVKRSGQYKRYRYLYPLMAKMYTYQGNAGLSALYMDSASFVTDSLGRQFNGLMLARALQKDAITEQKARLASIENKKKLLTLKFYVFVIFALIAFLATLYIYRIKRLKHKQEQALKDLQLKEREKELVMAQDQLLDFTQHLAEKNNLIRQMEQQNGKERALEELEQSVILTGKDWARFRELFEHVHPGYLERLFQKIPYITPAETRLMALAKLSFSNKEMAAALGVTPQAIRVTWHRLRKKTNLPDDGSIEELLSQV